MAHHQLQFNFLKPAIFIGKQATGILAIAQPVHAGINMQDSRQGCLSLALIARQHLCLLAMIDNRG